MRLTVWLWVLLFHCGAGLHVDVRWSPLAGQFYLSEREEMKTSMLGSDGEAPRDAMNVKLGRYTTHHVGGRPSSDLSNWVYKQVKLEHSRRRFKLHVEDVESTGRFRVGLTGASLKIKPGSVFYREWMVDSRGSWVVVGVPDPAGSLSVEDTVWGSYGIDGWGNTSSIVMDVDLDKERVRFIKGGPGTSSSSKTFLEFSLDGFAPIQVSQDGTKVEETLTHVSVKQVLLVDNVQYEFETANFGPDIPMGEGIATDLVPAIPINGCEPLTPSVAAQVKGRVMYALRGECDFLDKVLHAQNAGALAVVVADNSHEKGQQKGGQYNLVIMDQFNRPADAARIKIPSVFVSNKLHRYVVEKQAGSSSSSATVKGGASSSKGPIKVILKGAVYAPSHQGLHWKETGLSPGVWIQPGSRVTFTDLSDKNEESGPETCNNTPVLCRPLQYLPLVSAERKAIIYELFSLAATGSSSKTVSKNIVSTKRLVANGQVCNEHQPNDFSWLKLELPSSRIIPWEQRRSVSEGSDTTQLGEGWSTIHVPGLLVSPQTVETAMVDPGLCQNISSIRHDKTQNAYTLVVSETKGSPGLIPTCQFMYTLLDTLNGRFAPKIGQFHSGYRARIRYFWQARLLENTTAFAAAGVIIIPYGEEQSENLWAIGTTPGIMFRKGKKVNVGTSSVDVGKAMAWSSYVGILLDLAQDTVTFFTDPHHSRWVTMKLVPDAPSVPVLGGFGNTRSPTLSLGTTPFFSLEMKAKVSISGLFPQEYADRMSSDMVVRQASSTCTQVHPEITICH